MFIAATASRSCCGDFFVAGVEQSWLSQEPTVPRAVAPHDSIVNVRLGNRLRGVCCRFFAGVFCSRRMEFVALSMFDADRLRPIVKGVIDDGRRLTRAGWE
jgi:hypothetical protein